MALNLVVALVLFLSTCTAITRCDASVSDDPLAGFLPNSKSPIQLQITITVSTLRTPVMQERVYAAYPDGSIAFMLYMTKM